MSHKHRNEKAQSGAREGTAGAKVRAGNVLAPASSTTDAKKAINGEGKWEERGVRGSKGQRQKIYILNCAPARSNGREKMYIIKISE